MHTRDNTHWPRELAYDWARKRMFTPLKFHKWKVSTQETLDMDLGEGGGRRRLGSAPSRRLSPLPRTVVTASWLLSLPPVQSRCPLLTEAWMRPARQVPGGDTEAIFLQQGSEHVCYASVSPRAETALLFGFRMECKSLSPAHTLPQDLAPLPSVPLAHTPHALPLWGLWAPRPSTIPPTPWAVSVPPTVGHSLLPVSELILPRSVPSSLESLSSGLGTQ